MPIFCWSRGPQPQTTNKNRACGYR
jgi:hypothetical protein